MPNQSVTLRNKAARQTGQLRVYTSTFSLHGARSPGKNTSEREVC